MRVILHGDDIESLAVAARAALRFQEREGRPDGDLLGLRIDGKFYSVKWNKASMSVWSNEAAA